MDPQSRDDVLRELAETVAEATVDAWLASKIGDGDFEETLTDERADKEK